MSAAYEVLNSGSRTIVVKWVLTSANPTGAPYPSSANFPDKSVHVFGTFGGSSVAIKGSNEIVDSPTSMIALNKPDGTTIAIAAAGVAAVLENTRQIAPYLTGGSGASLTVMISMVA